MGLRQYHERPALPAILHEIGGFIFGLLGRFFKDIDDKQILFDTLIANLLRLIASATCGLGCGEP
jgi:hypothetical protein